MPERGAALFAPLPSDEAIRITWPTPNQQLLVSPERFFARTKANPDYGRPGWTRDCGARPHYGCDIAPVNTTPAGRLTTVIFTDCATGQDYPSDEPVLIPLDDVFCVFDGIVEDVIRDPDSSIYGRHVIIKHQWPQSGEPFFTLYGHLAQCTAAGHISAGERIGQMGQTSSIADARNWMLIAPHLHFEVRDHGGGVYNPMEFLARFLR